MSRSPPGPTDWLGGLGNLVRLQKNPLRFLLELGQKYGDLACFRVPAPPFRVCLVNHPNLIRDVLLTKSKSFRKVEQHTQVIKQFAGNGLIASEGDLWLRQRRLVQPAFHARRMSRYAQAVVEHTRRLFDHWRPGTEINMLEEMTQLSLAIIAKTLFGVELTGKAARLSEASHILAETALRETIALFTLPDWLPLPFKRRKRWAFQTFDNLVWDILRERRASGEDKGDLLSMLLLAVDDEGDSQGMTDQQARDEVMSLFIAGHDTPAAALTWTWYVLHQYPQVRARLLQEVADVLGDRPATLEDVPRLQYTARVLKEVLRLYPPTWVLMTRQALTAVELGPYLIPKGTWLLLAPLVTHRDARFFANPEQFDPERFAPERSEQIPPYAYFPFGAGPHVCIGTALAQMAMTLIVPTILQQFEVSLAPGQSEVEADPHVTMRPKGGLRMNLSKRQAGGGA
jgi:cytochrome P450